MASLRIPVSRSQLRQVIFTFREEHAFLSNMYEELGSPVILPAESVEVAGHTINLPEMAFNTTEQGYMAWKTLDVSIRAALAKMTPKDAKRATHKPGFPTRPDYSNEGRLAIMLELNRQKFGPQNPKLREKLQKTGDAILIEGNTWSDTFFGMSAQDSTTMEMEDLIAAFVAAREILEAELQQNGKLDNLGSTFEEQLKTALFRAAAIRGHNHLGEILMRVRGEIQK